MSIHALVLTSAQLTAAVEALEGVHVPTRTLSEWATSGLLVPSVRHDGQRGFTHARLYSLADLARLRLVVRLRQVMSLPRVRLALAYCEAQLQDVFATGKRSTLSMVVTAGGRAFIASKTGDEEVITGQFRLQLADVQVGIRNAAIAAQKVA